MNRGQDRSRRLFHLLLTALLLAACNCPAARGEWCLRQVRSVLFHHDDCDPPPDPPPPSLYLPADDGDIHRAGYPHQVSCLAKTMDSRRYCGYYVGGGSPCYKHSRGRCAEEGTWGWDYVGAVVPRRVGLNWWRRPVYQGGTGGYQPDGPKIIKPH